MKKVLNLIEKAEQHVYDICEGRKKWTMQIPINKEEDSDCIIMAALTAAREALEPLNKENANVCACRSKNLCEFINGKWFCIKCEKEIVSAQR